MTEQPNNPMAKRYLAIHTGKSEYFARVNEARDYLYRRATGTVSIYQRSQSGVYRLIETFEVPEKSE